MNLSESIEKVNRIGKLIDSSNSYVRCRPRIANNDDENYHRLAVC